MLRKLRLSKEIQIQGHPFKDVKGAKLMFQKTFMNQNCFDGVEMISVSKDKNIFGFLNIKNFIL